MEHKVMPSTHQRTQYQHGDHHTGQVPDSHKKHSGHGVDHSGHELMFRNRFWVSLVLTIPVLLFSPMIQEWFGFAMPEFTGSNLIGPGFAIAIFLYGGLPFLQMALPEVQSRKPGMMTLISLAITVAFAYSLFAIFAVPDSGFFWEMATLIDIMLLGHWLEMRSVRQASGALNELAKLMPDTAERIREDGSIEEVGVTDLSKDDLLLVRPGSSMPTDGEIVEGDSELNEALLIYSEPDPESDILEAAVSGVVLRIIDGPALINDVRWWKVRSISGIEGWTPGVVDGDAVLVPLSEMVTPTATPTAPPITATSTPQNLPNILRVGGQARVYVEDEGLKLRSSHDVNSSILENLPVGTVVTLLAGPVSGGAYRWWQARSPAGNEGWLVESADGITTLIPIAAVPTANTSGLDGQFALSAEVQIVSLEPAFPLRASPSMRAAVITNLSRSERASIIGGPQVVSESEGGVPQNFIWWQIRAAGGTEGWIQAAYYGEPVLISYNPANPIQPVTCTLSTFRDVNIRRGPGTGYEQIASREGANQILAADGQHGDIATPEAHWWRLYSGFWIRDDQVSEQTRESCAPLASGRA